MITIHNERLEIQIQEPGSQYKRARFDWCGICQQITLDGQHTFLSREADANNPGTEGIGLSDEFGLNTPLGYAEIAAGEWFPKIGVGFLQKAGNGSYDFFSDYPLRPAKIQVEASGDQAVTFRQLGESHAGWRWRWEKTFLLTGTTLKIVYDLKNTGEKAIRTESYNHNFLQVDGHAVGPEYALQVSFPLKLAIMDGPMAVDDHTLRLTEIPARYVYAQQPDCASLREVTWSLIHQPSGHGVCGSEPFAVHQFALWGMRHVISPEFFVWIDLNPGETQTWERIYEFF